METTARPAVELRSIDSNRSRARRYHMAECRSLFGELALLITWGRIGQSPRVRLETFATAEALIERREALLARRSAHGYHVSNARSDAQASALVS